MFRDREEAAQRLCQRLSAFQGRNPLVLAIPRGGVPMGKLLADQLGGEFDVVLARKLRAPLQPELAVGAVDESGWTYIDPSAASQGADADYLAAETRTQMRTIHNQRDREFNGLAFLRLKTVDENHVTDLDLFLMATGLHNRVHASFLAMVL